MLWNERSRWSGRSDHDALRTIGMVVRLLHFLTTVARLDGPGGARPGGRVRLGQAPVTDSESLAPTRTQPLPRIESSPRPENITIRWPRSYNVITQNMTTKARIVRIGNSRGIRIPKTLLAEAELADEVELHAEPGRLVVEAVRHTRPGWAAAAKRMRARGEDRSLDGPTPTRFDQEEWEWR